MFNTYYKANALEQGYKNEVIWFINNFIEDEYEDEKIREIIKKEVDLEKVQEVADNLLNDWQLNELLNQRIRHYLVDDLYTGED